VPLVRRKVQHVLTQAGKDPESHNGKRLRNVLETWPRDELFQTDEAQLLATAMGVLHLYDRPRVKLFARRDPFDRFISVLLFVPRDRYDSGVRARAGDILARGVPGSGVGLLSELFRRAAGPRSLHPRRHARRPRRSRFGRRRSRHRRDRPHLGRSLRGRRPRRVRPAASPSF
jgi:NAD-specific glutamate dehydrogenase